MKRFKLLKIILLTLVLLGAAVFSLYLYFLYHFELVPIHREIILPPGYESMDGMKIVLFTDLHMLDSLRDQQKLRHIIKRINIEKPDIILYGGDMLATENLESRMLPARIIARMRKLAAKDGVYAVTGNHDWVAHAGTRLVDKMEQVGIVVLDNSSVTIKDKCNIVGLQDQDGPMGVQPQLAMRNIDPKLPTIALIHRPEYSAKLPENVKLFFAGHTHGGQINLPYLRELFLKQAGEENFGEREYDLKDDRHLFISYGIGTSWMRVRINCPSDIIIFNCRSKKNENPVK